MGKFIAVIDYGLGNLRSVSKALECAGAKVKVTNKPDDITSASAIVLPGVGAFKVAMDNLKKLGLVDPLIKTIKEGKPFLGICLGLQVLFSESAEHGTSQGLGLIKGEVKKFSSDVKIPHMGWNAVKLSKDNPGISIFKGISDESYFYFVHSYYVEPEDKSLILTTSEYGQSFTSAISKDNIWGMQFHPEKSEKLGLQILRNFVSYVS